MAKYNPAIQIKGLKKIENDLINNLSFRWKYNSVLVFNFSLTNTFIYIEGKKNEKDFSNYKIRIEYSHKSEPKVFIDEPSILNSVPHRYPDKSLCLYKKTKFSWSNSNSIAKDIVTLIIMWVYYYEIWKITNVWYGREASH